jgi:hypothetical protein
MAGIGQTAVTPVTRRRREHRRENIEIVRVFWEMRVRAGYPSVAGTGGIRPFIKKKPGPKWFEQVKRLI